MESLFFNITDRRYTTTPLFHLDSNNFMHRVDLSNGVLFFHIKLQQRSKVLSFQGLDRMVLIVMVQSGYITLEDYLAGEQFSLKSGEMGIYGSARQSMSLHIPKAPKSDVFILAIADFFLKRYLSGQEHEVIDFLYAQLQEDISLLEINRQPIGALGLYSVQQLLSIEQERRMQRLRAEHQVIGLMIHCFLMMDILDEEIALEDRTLAQRAKAILLEEYVDPPTIKVLAHRCATNESKLKRVFKQVYQSTLHQYIQRLRLEQANLLLKEESLSIGEIAKRVGYRHQGYFSKLFYRTYGIYPATLLH